MGWIRRYLASVVGGITLIFLGGLLIDKAFGNPAQIYLANALHLDADTVDATNDRGIALVGSDGTGWQVVAVDTSGRLQIVTASGVQAGVDVQEWNGVAPTAAAALADNLANPTAPSVGAHGMVWDGSAWDRWPGTSADGGEVQVTVFPDNEPINVAQIGGSAVAAGAGVVTTGTQRTTLASDVGLPAGTNNIGDVDVLSFPDNEPFNLAQWNGVAPSAAAALADNLTNPTAPSVGAHGLLWDGATWDRWPGDSSDGARVELYGAGAALIGQQTAAGSVPVVLPSDTVHEFQGDQVVPQAPATVACDDTGAIAFTANAADMRLEIRNANTANDVVVVWCAGSCAGVTPDRTSATSYSFRLGSSTASGTDEVYVTPADFRIGGEAFECDTAGAPANLIVTAWRTQ